MTTRHRVLLADAVAASAALAERLKDSACYVTGASGFLASSLIAFLSELDRVYQVGLRLFASARRPSAEVRLFPFLGIQPRVEWVIATTEEAKLPAVGNLIVVHAASYGSPKNYLRDPIATFSANTLGLINLLRGAGGGQVRQLVFFSSAEVYGQPPPEAIPTAENYQGTMDTLSVRSIYGESKRMGEVLGTCLAEKAGIPLTIVRPWNLYGPGQRWDDGRVPIEFLRQALQERTIRLASNGSPRRAFCFAWDGIRQIAATLGLSGKVLAFNIGNGTEEISILGLAQSCATACGLPESAVWYDPAARALGLQRCLPEVSAVLRLTPGRLDFTPLSVGLPLLVEWLDFLTPDA